MSGRATIVPASISGCTAHRASKATPSPAFTSSVIASVNCTSSMRGDIAGRQQHLLQHPAFLPRRIDEQRLVAHLGDADVRLLREAVMTRGDEHDLVLEHLPRDQAPVGHRRADDGEIDLAGQEHRDRRARRLDVDPHLDARKLAAVSHQQRRQPVIAGVALGGDPQHAGVLLPHPADVLLGLRQALEDVLRGHQQPLAGGREHQTLADAQEERRAQPRFDAAELVAERRLGQVQPVAGARQAAHVRDGGDQLQMPDFEIHTHENTSSS